MITLLIIGSYLIQVHTGSLTKLQKAMGHSSINVS
jgi:hypothetical protein